MFKTDKNLSVLEHMPFNTSSLRELAYPWTGMGEWEPRAAHSATGNYSMIDQADACDLQLNR